MERTTKKAIWSWTNHNKKKRMTIAKKKREKVGVNGSLRTKNIMMKT
jgi:hypothetical protein